MNDSLHSLLIILFITTISAADNSTTPENFSATDATSSTTDSLETSPISSTTYPPCLIPIENRIYMEWITFYTLLLLIFALSFLVFIFLIVWIRDTEKLKKNVKELEKKIQDMELYGVIKPQKNPPKRVQLPKRSDKKESKIVKVVNEVKSEEKTDTPKKKKTTKRSAKKKKEQKKNETQTPQSVTDDSSVTCSKDSTDTRTTEATTEESKTQLGSKTETSVTGTVVEADKTQEKSPIDSIATAEVNILSRKVY